MLQYLNLELNPTEVKVRLVFDKDDYRQVAQKIQKFWSLPQSWYF